MNIKGITGDGPKGMIVLNSFQWGIGRGIALSGGNREASTPSFSEITITKPMDSSSPQLASMAASGTSGVPCVLTMVDHTTGAVLYKLSLQNVLFSGYSVSTGGEQPSESLSLNYTQITWVYQTLDSSGNPVGSPSSPMGWDLELQKSLP